MAVEEDYFLLKSITATAQPTSGMVDGDAYFVPVGATGTEWPSHVGELALWEAAFSIWVYKEPPRHSIYVVEDQPEAGRSASMVYLGSNEFGLLANAEDYQANDTWYVSKSSNHASDNNSGKSPFDPFETIQAAIDAADAATPTGTNPHSVYVLDGETYNEDLEIPDNVLVTAQSATISGYVTIGENSLFDCHFHYHVPISSEAAVDATGNSAVYRARIVIMAASSLGILNTSAGDKLVVDIGTIFNQLAAKGLGGSTSDGEIVGQINWMYNASSGGIISDNAASVISLLVNKLTGEASSVGIDVNSGECSIIANEVNCNTAFDVSGGTLNLTCPNVTGTQTHSAGTLKWLGEDDTGTSFPSNPREGRCFYRSDLEEWFYYDSSRSKWLGKRTYQLQGFYASGLNSPPTYLFVAGGVPYSANIGWVAPYDCIVTEMGVITPFSSTSEFTVYDDGSAVTGATISLSSQLNNQDGALNSNTIAAGSIVAMAFTSGSFTGGCYVTAVVRRVAT